MSPLRPDYSSPGAGSDKTGSARLASLQPWLYGGGQLLHIVGLVWSGGYGMQRKVAGAEQVLRSSGEVVAMGIMRLGGLVAVAGGLLFVWVVAASLLPPRACSWESGT